MANNCKSTDKKMVRKRRSEDPATLDNNSMKKRLRGYRPKISLLDLNDHCLLTIFENLNEVDICHVQNVCKRFVPLAESTFRNIRRMNSEQNIFRMGYSESEIRRIAYKFAHLINSTGTRFSCSEKFSLIESKLVRLSDKLKIWFDDLGNRIDGLRKNVDELLKKE